MGTITVVTKPPPESHIMGGPPLRTPLTELSGGFNLFDGHECEPFELRFLDCAEAYGMLRSKEKCKLLFQDFVECGRKWKQLERIDLMRRERRRQYWHGQVGLGPKVPRFKGGVPEDSFAPDPWEDIK